MLHLQWPGEAGLSSPNPSWLANKKTLPSGAGLSFMDQRNSALPAVFRGNDNRPNDGRGSEHCPNHSGKRGAVNSGFPLIRLRVRDTLGGPVLPPPVLRGTVGRGLKVGTFAREY